MRGQAALEFLINFSLVLVILVISVFIYSDFMDNSVKINKQLEANKICVQTASTINSMAALGGNSTYVLQLPDDVDYNEYSIWISSYGKAINVDYGTGSAGCSLQTGAIRNSTGAQLFRLEKNATLTANEGDITVTP